MVALVNCFKKVDAEPSSLTRKELEVFRNAFVYCVFGKR